MAVSSPTSRAVCPRSHVASGGCPHLLLWLLSLSHSTMSSCQSQARSTSSPLYRPVIPIEPAGTSPNAGLGSWAFAFCPAPFCHFCATVSTHHKARVALRWFPSTSAKQEVGGKSHQVFLSCHLPPLPCSHPHIRTGCGRRQGPAPNLSCILLQARKGFHVFL